MSTRCLNTFGITIIENEDFHVFDDKNKKNQYYMHLHAVENKITLFYLKIRV